MNGLGNTSGNYWTGTILASPALKYNTHCITLWCITFKSHFWINISHKDVLVLWWTHFIHPLQKLWYHTITLFNIQMHWTLLHYQWTHIMSYSSSCIPPLHCIDHIFRLTFISSNPNAQCCTGLVVNLCYALTPNNCIIL